MTRTEPAGPIRVLIVDDHPIVRRGLRAALDADPGITVVGEAATGVDAIEQAEATTPDVVLMDLNLGPGINGAEATRRLLAHPRPPRVLVLTTYDSDADILPAITAGATGYLLKDTEPDDLLAAIRSAAAGETVLAPAIATRLITRVRAPGGRSPHARSRFCGWSPRGTPTRRSAGPCSSPRPPSSPTSSRCSPSSVSTTAPPPSPKAAAAASFPDRLGNIRVLGCCVTSAPAGSDDLRLAACEITSGSRCRLGYIRA